MAKLVSDIHPYAVGRLANNYSNDRILTIRSCPHCERIAILQVWKRNHEDAEAFDRSNQIGDGTVFHLHFLPDRTSSFDCVFTCCEFDRNECGASREPKCQFKN